ncbi:hypothetical protein FB45DRAFT_1090947 [Roridomyces roridus]|uniref:NmrA-like domain-containing protein n=1 Tax=Roridomyces roridus TaxID=1738132 RepID=A0AAD7FJA5_9AGAR|nr:hypothetical protein FB45DRAFT_1090947 [Roridomyces roridus]
MIFEILYKYTVLLGDPLDKASLVSALRGSEGVFMVTVPVKQPIEVDGELQDEVMQGRNIIEAAKQNGVKFLVSTSLPSINKISGGKYKNCFHYEGKAMIEEHVRSSGIPHAFLHLGAFLENLWNAQSILKKTSTGFTISVQNQTPQDIEAFTWVGRQVPAAALALLKSYLVQGDSSVANKTYPLVNEATSYADLARRTGQVLGVEVTFTTAPESGMAFMDEMYAAHAEYSGLYTDTPVPNPGLLALGVEFGSIEEFLKHEVKPRFGVDTA